MGLAEQSARGCLVASMTRLHLGCGQVHLDGYVNIDFPPEQHTVLDVSAADVFADLRTLRYPAMSIDEVRAHHVFEHFSRATAAALLASWRSWLKVDGCIRIEVPDFDRTAKRVLNPLRSERERQVALRHIFGSHEAHWAMHQDGWSPRRLRRLAESLGFRGTRIERSQYLGTFNCTIIALRDTRVMSFETALDVIAAYLHGFALDDSPSEQRLREIWLDEARRQLSASWAA